MMRWFELAVLVCSTKTICTLVLANNARGNQIPLRERARDGLRERQRLEEVAVVDKEQRVHGAGQLHSC